MELEEGRDRVENLGGKVTRDEKATGKLVVLVGLFSTQVTDAGLKELTPLKNLTTLDLSYTQVTDAVDRGRVGHFFHVSCVEFALRETR